MKAALSFVPITFLFASVSVVQGYDYVIVGGGTGGLTVASRLSEDPSVTVAVIEAGLNAEALPEVFIPGPSITGTPDTLNWRYATVPQTHLNGRNLTVNAGKALGGSTVINSMIFLRAGKEQYDVWGQLNNDHSWTWDGLLPYFKKSEIFSPPTTYQAKEHKGDIRFDPNVHGFHGNVKVGFPNFYFPQSSFWTQAAVALGFPISSDLANGAPHAVGVTPHSIDAANNTRCSAACAYFTPFSDRPNLSVLLNATVSRVLWKTQTTNGKLIASGVEFVQGGKTLRLPVEREVLLASGTIGTPKVLELSGIGNTTILSTAGIKPVLDLPSVGENLADHAHSWASSFTNITLTWDRLLLNATFAAEQRDLWFKNRTGMLSATSICALGLAAPHSIFGPSELRNLINHAQKNLSQYATQFSNGNLKLAKGIRVQHEFALSLYEKDEALPLELNLIPGYGGATAFGTRPNRTYATISSVLYAPLSRGRSHIISADPLTAPAVDPNYWAHPIDVAAQIGGVKLARRMFDTPPLSSVNSGEFEPGTLIQTDEEIEEWLRGTVFSDNHEVGTASMMPQDLGGVVDTSLTVYGTKNVRVVDASIIPFPTSAHMSSTIYAIGEKAADIIKKNS